eukprot:15470233-Alexandrium_andersonii.AAC.1
MSAPGPEGSQSVRCLPRTGMTAGTVLRPAPHRACSCVDFSRAEWVGVGVTVEQRLHQCCIE